MTSPDPDPSNRPASAAASDVDFSARLTAARRLRGLDGPAATSSSVDGSALGIGVRVGVELLAAIVVAVAIGWGLDRWLGTRPVFLALFVLLGGAAGVLNVWRLVGSGTGAPPR